MPALGTKRYIVTVRQGKIRPRGGIEAPLDRHFTVYAKTSRGAKSAIENAGIRGTVIEVNRQ